MVIALLKIGTELLKLMEFTEQNKRRACEKVPS